MRSAKRKQASAAQEAPAKPRPKFDRKPIIQLQPPSDAQEEAVKIELVERSSLNSPTSPTADADADPDADVHATVIAPANAMPRNELDAVNGPLVCADGECANNRPDEHKTSEEVHSILYSICVRVMFYSDYCSSRITRFHERT